jgi:hypothetical protein
MQQNWWELPGVVEFCNAQGVGVYFNTVTWPPETALKNLKEAELAEVVDYLVARSPKADTPGGKENVSRYKDVISQIKSYQAAPIS